MQQARQERLARERQQEAEQQARREQKLQEAMAARERAAEQARKEQAWAAFYKPLKQCAKATKQDIIDACEAYHQRELERFEARWADGKI